MEILTLGSGTSHGVPMIGCECEVCRSQNPKNKRFRPSVTVTGSEGTILVDTTPELRLQSLTFEVMHVEAVLMTHSHADHLFGLDDLRRFNDLADREMPVYASPDVQDDIRRVFDYIFKPTQTGGGKPRIMLHDLESDFRLCGLRVRPLDVLHGKLPVKAFRFDDPKTGGSFGYVTDVSTIPDKAKEALRDLDLLFMDAVRYEPHPTHFGLYQALDAIAELKPKRAYLTHLSHHFEHERTNAELPFNVELAYDGLRIEC